jgi:N-acetylglucosaminyl-diphospho-decaprenol L-rhamnosyltransferase
MEDTNPSIMTVPHYPDLSLATTTHNNLERWMEMALSFERYVGTVAEIVVVDDGSRVSARIEGLRSPLRLIRNETPQGFCAASDQALKEVKTPYGFLLDADITFLPGNFEHAFDAFKAARKLAWSNFQQIGSSGDIGSPSEDRLPPPLIFALGSQVQWRWSKWKAKTAKSEWLNGRIKGVTIAHSSSTLVRMKAFHEIGGFDLRFWQCESDNDVCLRLREAGWKVGVDQIYTLRHDGIGGRTGGMKRIYDLYRSRLMLYEIHRPASRAYLRKLLGVRHLLEGAAATLVPRKRDDHLRPDFRFRLASAAFKGYPKWSD